MSIDRVYIEAAIETFDLVHQIANYLHSKQETGEMDNFLTQILTKADSKISSALGQRLGISIPVDQEGKPAKYWEGVRDTAKLAMKQWQSFNEIPKLLSFLEGTRSNLAAKIGIVEATVNPLEAFIGEAPVPEAGSPLEEMLSTPQPTPTPVPEPTPVAPPQPEPVASITPEPEPEPLVPEPTPTPVTPSLESIQPEPTPEPIPQPSDKLSALDEALKSSGLESSPPPEPSPSLSDMLLSKDDTSEKTDEEDDMLSLSLREALKILRDEDEG